MATLLKRNKIWYIKFSQYHQGKRRYITKSLETTSRSKAEKEQERLEGKQRVGENPFSDEFWNKPSKTKGWWTVGECSEEFLKEKKKLSYDTHRGYFYVLNSWMDFIGCKTAMVDSLTPEEHIAPFLQRKGIGSNTANSERSRLRTFTNWLVKKKRLSNNLMDDIELPKTDVQYRPKMINRKELDLIFKAYDEHIEERKGNRNYRKWQSQLWFKPAIATIFFTGIRLRETGKHHKDSKSGLTGSNIIGIPNKKIEYIYIGKAKINRERYAPVNKTLEKYLLEYFKIRGWPKENEFVFLNGKGFPLAPRSIYDAFKFYLKKAKLPKTRTVHGMRHARGSILIEQGLTLKEVKDVLGHASIKTTDELYTHISPKTILDKVRNLDE